MKDIQDSYDSRNIPINYVGVQGLNTIFLIKQRDGNTQKVTAETDAFVGLHKNKKGAHMSRIVEIVEKHRNVPLSSNSSNAFLSDLLYKLSSDNAYLKATFKYFIQKTAPISSKSSLMDHECSIIAIKTSCDIKNFTYLLTAKSSISLLCPCSKEISENGAHNQRGVVKLTVSICDDLFFEDLFDIIDSSGSCSVYPILKRQDEKFITESAYNNPKFVEDVVRDISLKLATIKKIINFKITCKSYESIHNHNAIAQINNFKNQDKDYVINY